MKKIICFKIKNQAQADFASKVLTKIGLKKQNSPQFTFRSLPDQDYLILEDNIFLFTYPEVAQNYLIVNSWRDFVFEFLKSYSVKCESPQNKQYFIDFFKLLDWGGNRMEDMDHPFVRFNYGGAKRFFSRQRGTIIFSHLIKPKFSLTLSLNLIILVRIKT